MRPRQTQAVRTSAATGCSPHRFANKGRCRGYEYRHDRGQRKQSWNTHRSTPFDPRVRRYHYWRLDVTV